MKSRRIFQLTFRHFSVFKTSAVESISGNASFASEAGASPKKKRPKWTKQPVSKPKYPAGLRRDVEARLEEKRISPVEVDIVEKNEPSTASKLIPDWMKNMIPGLRAKGDQPPGADKWKDLHKAKNIGVTDYAAYNRYHRSTLTPPFSSDAKGVDEFMRQRIVYARLSQHERIAGTMTAEEQATVSASPSKAQKNQELLAALAHRCALSTEEVKDCIRSYSELRTDLKLLYKHYKSGQKMPDTSKELNSIVKELRDDDEADVLRQMRARGDVQACPILPKLALLGRSARCTKTHLPYYMCCGKTVGKKVAVKY